MITDLDYVVDASPAYVVTLASLCVSVCTLTPLLLAFLRSADLQRLPARLQFYTCIVNAVWSCAALGTSITASLGVGIPCGFVGVLTQFVCVASILWYAMIFFNLRKIVRNVATTGHDEVRYHIIVWSVAAAAVFPAFLVEVEAISTSAPSVYDLAVYRTCFLQATQAPLRFGTLSAVAILVLLFMLYVSFWAIAYVRERNPHDTRSVRQLRVRCIRYITAFVLIWALWVAEDIYLLTQPDSSESIPTIITAAKALLFYSQGAINAVTYGANKWHNVRTQLPVCIVNVVNKLVWLLRCAVGVLLHMLCCCQRDVRVPITSSTVRRSTHAAIVSMARSLQDLDDHPSLLDSASVLSQDQDDLRSVAGELRIGVTGTSTGVNTPTRSRSVANAMEAAERGLPGSLSSSYRSSVPIAIPPGMRRGYTLGVRPAASSPQNAANATAKARAGGGASHAGKAAHRGATGAVPGGTEELRGDDGLVVPTGDGAGGGVMAAVSTSFRAVASALGLRNGAPPVDQNDERSATAPLLTAAQRSAAPPSPRPGARAPTAIVLTAAYEPAGAVPGAADGATVTRGAAMGELVVMGEDDVASAAALAARSAAISTPARHGGSAAPSTPRRTPAEIAASIRSTANTAVIESIIGSMQRQEANVSSSPRTPPTGTHASIAARGPHGSVASSLASSYAASLPAGSLVPSSMPHARSMGADREMGDVAPPRAPPVPSVPAVILTAAPSPLSPARAAASGAPTPSDAATAHQRTPSGLSQLFSNRALSTDRSSSSTSVSEAVTSLQRAFDDAEAAPPPAELAVPAVVLDPRGARQPGRMGMAGRGRGGRGGLGVATVLEEAGGITSGADDTAAEDATTEGEGMTDAARMYATDASKFDGEGDGNGNEAEPSYSVIDEDGVGTVGSGSVMNRRRRHPGSGLRSMGSGSEYQGSMASSMPYGTMGQSLPPSMMFRRYPGVPSRMSDGSVIDAASMYSESVLPTPSMPPESYAWAGRSLAPGESLRSSGLTSMPQTYATEHTHAFGGRAGLSFARAPTHVEVEGEDASATEGEVTGAGTASEAATDTDGGGRTRHPPSRAPTDGRYTVYMDE